MRRRAWLGWLLTGVLCVAGVSPARAQDPPPPIEIAGPGVVVAVRTADERALGERIAALYGEVTSVLRLRLGRAPGGPIRISTMKFGGGGDHTVGLATWSSRWVRIDPDRLGPLSSLPAVLTHEVTHVVVGEATQGQAPDWFDEGVAEWMGAAYGIADRRTLTEAAANGRLPTLESLAHGFPPDAEERRIAYAASREAIELMVADRGTDVVARILAECAGGRPFPEALVAASGQTAEHWNARLAAALAPGPGLIRRLFESDPSLVWFLIIGLGGLLAIYAAIVRTRRARKKMQATEDYERVFGDDAMTAHYAEHGGWEPEPDDESWRG